MSENELDILSIDSKIRKDFETEAKKLPEYHHRLAELRKTNENPDLPQRARLNLARNIQKLEETINKLETNADLNFYIADTAEYLQQYKKILQTPVKISFLGRSAPNIAEKRSIIDKYLSVAKKYYDINIDISNREKKIRMTCNDCPNKENFDIDENTYTCTECGSQQEILQQTSSYKDIDRVNISAKYTYDRRVHFRDCINQYQGKQNCTIDPKVYTDLESAFERHHLLVGDKNTDRKTRFSRIKKEHVLMFLKELGYSKHYENVILIHYNLTGVKPDDISHLEDELMNDFDLLIDTYDRKFKGKIDRTNFISTQYVLYQLLQRHKHPCKREDFVLLKTVDRKSFHDSICRQIFQDIGWTFSPSY